MHLGKCNCAVPASMKLIWAVFQASSSGHRQGIYYESPFTALVRLLGFPKVACTNVPGRVVSCEGFKFIAFSRVNSPPSMHKILESAFRNLGGPRINGRKAALRCSCALQVVRVVLALLSCLWPCCCSVHLCESAHDFLSIVPRCAQLGPDTGQTMASYRES